MIACVYATRSNSGPNPPNSARSTRSAATPASEATVSPRHGRSATTSRIGRSVGQDRLQDGAGSRHQDTDAHRARDTHVHSARRDAAIHEGTLPAAVPRLGAQPAVEQGCPGGRPSLWSRPGRGCIGAVRRAFPLPTVLGVVLAATGIAALIHAPTAAAATSGSADLSTLITPDIPAGFTATAVGNGASDQPTTTEPSSQGSHVPVSPPLYLQAPATTHGSGTADTLPTFWKLWWNPLSRQALAVSLAHYSSGSLARRAIAELGTELSGPKGRTDFTLTSTFVPTGIPGARGYNLTAPATATTSPFIVSAVLFQTGDVENLVSVFSTGTSPATATVSSFARTQYRYALPKQSTMPTPTPARPRTWPWIVGGIVLVGLVASSLVARRRHVVSHRRRHRRRRASVISRAFGQRQPSPRRLRSGSGPP